MTESAGNYLFAENEDEFLDSLLNKSILEKSQIKKIKLILKSGETELTVMQLILNLGMVSESDLLKHLAERKGLRILEKKEYPKKRYAEQNFNNQFLRERNVVVISEVDDLIELCINDPYGKGLDNAVSFALAQKYLKVRLGYKKDILDALEVILKNSEEKSLSDKFDLGSNEILLEKDIQQLKELASEAPVIKVVNAMIEEAIQQGASDIHIESQSNQLKVRNRLDGVLSTVREIDANQSAAVVSRIKILSSLDIAQRRVPQDGRFDIEADGRKVDIRVSILPTIYGESIVMRLLYKKSLNLNLDTLGYSEANKKSIIQMLSKPHGLILVTGPTGSGKSTTLYAMLQQINNSEKKIVSVEDPVEYKIDNINQIQVNADIGVSFSNALRAILRHDPEVIMVGEMRDSETAQIAVRASMTGHLIMTTLHTNSAVASIERLTDLGVDKSLIISSLVGVVAQRLVRRLCDHCKQPVSSSTISLKDLNGDIDMGSDMNCYESVGCEHCSQTGYNGRLAICEVMLVNDEFRSAIMSGNVTNLEQMANQHGMLPMIADGLEKVTSGETSIDEIFRVVLG